ncbi:hypothetical protein [Thalassobius sp. MITS945101]|uniref:hypothetical protein n=1 Tax=Thalassobius sp. MITS945101 TaxID=3096994 RepID=UPI00399ABDEA
MTPEELTTCVNAAFPLPSLLFVLGAAALALYLKRKHHLSIGQTFKAMVGVEKVAHDRTSATIAIATLVVPLGIWLLLGHRCG